MWVRNADARGTEAVKLSVKWLAGLAVLVLAVVAVVGSTSATKAATGSIFVANEWSKITNESSPPEDYTTKSTVFGTYGESGRITETDSDLIRVIVKDTGVTVPVATSASGTGEINVNSTGGNTISATITAGSSITIKLTGAGTTRPIAGTLADVQDDTSIIGSDTGQTELNGDELTITNFFAGSGSGDPVITAFVNIDIVPQTIDTVTYNTAQKGEVEVTIKSELNSSGVTIDAEETGIGTGRFEGFVRLEDNTVTPTNGTPGNTSGTAAKIQTNVGPVSFEFTDSDGAKRSTSVTIDTAAPTATITSPLNGSATTNRRPTFSGTISETGAGLSVDTIKVFVDDGDDAANDDDVVTSFVTGAILSGALDLGVSTSGAVDGDTAFSFSDSPDNDIPTLGSSVDPDHIVDWVVKVSDLAGNTGLSDSNPSTSDIDLPTVKIDQTDPNATNVLNDRHTGLAWDGSKEIKAKNSLRIAFIDKLQNVQATDFTVTLDNGSVRTPTKVTVVNTLVDADGDPFNVDDSNSATFDELLETISTGVGGAQSLVYLELSEDLVSSETPTVKLQDIISDQAGNAISQFLGFTDDEVDVADGIAPTLTVTLSGGSGTGTGSEDATGLTNDEIEIMIVSDESLSGAPTVAVHIDDGAADSPAPIALGQGTNTWVATYSAPSSVADGKRAIKITSVDVAANSGTTGGTDADEDGTPNFRLDTELSDPVLTVGGATNNKTDQTRPSIIIDYKNATTPEASTVTLSKVQLDGTDITADVVAASDGKRFFYIPPSDLSLGDHDLLIESGDAKDAAGNENATDTKLTVTIEERDTFDLDMFAGWNALSFPSDPVDPSINSVFTNAGHDAVLGFDPNVPGQWRVAVRDTVSGMLEPATENGLTTISSTQAYWVHSNNFEQVSALLVGEVLPASGSPPGIVTIPTVTGFNAIPIVDTSRKQTTGSSAALERQIPSGTTTVTVADYLGEVDEGRVYKYNPENLTMEELSGSTTVNTGEVLFVEVTTPRPIFP